MNTPTDGALDAEFEKADIILADALLQFQDQGVSQYVFGMALLEIGIATLVKLEESDEGIADVVRGFIDKSRQFQAHNFPIPSQ